MLTEDCKSIESGLQIRTNKSRKIFNYGSFFIAFILFGSLTGSLTSKEKDKKQTKKAEESIKGFV